MAVQAGESTPKKKLTKVRRGTRGNPCTIQDLYLAEYLTGVRLADECGDVPEVKRRLQAELPQNSPETRERYAIGICQVLFPDRELASVPLLAWRAYRDEQILLDHFRVRYIEAIPLVSKFVTGPLGSADIGATVDGKTVATFVSRECEFAVPDTVGRLPRNLAKLGFLARVGKDFVRTVPTYDSTSVALELHRVFSQGPTTIPFSEIAAHPFWRYLGVPDVPTLERILYAAVGSQMLSKFVKSDELNQVTTGCSYTELLAMRLRVMS